MATDSGRSEISRILSRVRHLSKQMSGDDEIDTVVILSENIACAKAIQKNFEETYYLRRKYKFVLLNNQREAVNFVQTNRYKIHAFLFDVELSDRLKNVLDQCDFPVFRVEDNLEVESLG